MDCHFLLQGIFPTWGLNPGLPHCRQTLYPLSHQGSPTFPTLFHPFYVQLNDFLVNLLDFPGGTMDGTMGVCLPMQGMQIQFLLGEDSTCCRAVKARAPQLLEPIHSRASEPQLQSPSVSTTEAHAPRICALQQEKPPQ